MGVDVDQPRDDGLARHVDDAGPGRGGARRGHARDAVVGRDQVALLDQLVALHRDDAGTPQHDRAARHIARDANPHIDALALVRRELGEGIHAGFPRGIGLLFGSLLE